jgi:hypothetical protein
VNVTVDVPRICVFDAEGRRIDTMPGRVQRSPAVGGRWYGQQPHHSRPTHDVYGAPPSGLP